MLAGTGKTRIAVELIRQHSQQLIARSQVAVFLTPSVPLGAQVGADWEALHLDGVHGPMTDLHSQP